MELPCNQWRSREIASCKMSSRCYSPPPPFVTISPRGGGPHAFKASTSDAGYRNFGPRRLIARRRATVVLTHHALLLSTLAPVRLRLGICGILPGIGSRLGSSLQILPQQCRRPTSCASCPGGGSFAHDVCSVQALSLRRSEILSTPTVHPIRIVGYA